MASPRISQRKETSFRSALVSEGTGWEPSVAERIRRRAYELFEARTRSGAHGDPTTDWLQAEREVKVGSRQAR